MAETQLQSTFEEKINRLYYMREDIRRVEAELKGLKDAFRLVEGDVLDELSDAGIKKAGTELAAVSISEDEAPTVDPEHWDDVWMFLIESGYTEVLRKQLNSTPWKELKKLGVEIPHVTSTPIKKLNLRKA